MKRAIVLATTIVVGAGVAVSAALIGPDLVDYYRFERALDRQVEASQADGGPWPQLQETCFACHGPRGQSSNGQYPSLSGQPAEYLEAQLRDFASERRRSATMGPLARNLTEGQIKLMAAYYAGQAAAGGVDVETGAAIDKQGQLAIRAGSCQACHGEALLGKGRAPRLAGQAEIYLASQLAAFKTGERHDATGAMDGIAATLSDEDIPAVARHLAKIAPRRDDVRKPD
jgi:cytochrome c553